MFLVQVLRPIEISIFSKEHKEGGKRFCLPLFCVWTCYDGRNRIYGVLDSIILGMVWML